MVVIDSLGLVQADKIKHYIMKSIIYFNTTPVFNLITKETTQYGSIPSTTASAAIAGSSFPPSHD